MPAITGNPSEAVTATVGAYLFDTVALSEQVEVSGGLRWDRSAVDYTLTTLATGEQTALSRTDVMVNWQAGVVYKPQPNGSVYAGAGTSFIPAADMGNAGTALSASPTAANNINLVPERTRNVEVGTKWTAFDDRLAVNGAVFRTEKTNARTRSLSSEPFVLAGRQRVQGVEGGASGTVARGWTAFAALTLMDSEIVASANDDEIGRDLTLAPKASASLWLTGPVTSRLTIGGGGQFMDGVFRNTTTDLTVPSYWLVNAMAAYEVNSHLTLRVNANNLTDERYADRVGGGHYIPGPRRSVQVTTDVGF
jgi:catecholate siderophore receptor